MFLVSFLLLIFGGPATAAVIWHKRIELTLALSIMLNGLLLFFFGSLGLLVVGWWVVCCWNILLWGIVIIQIFRKRILYEFLHAFLTPGLAFFLFGLLFFYCRSYWLMFTGWDEFSHWGTVSAAVYKFEQLPHLLKDQLLFASYPPGTSLLSYPALKCYGAFQEGIVFFSYQAFLLSLLIIGLAYSTWRDIYPNFLYCITLLLMPLLFFNAYQTVYVDCILGILFGYAGVYLIGTRENKKLRYPALAIIFSFLFLLKQSGIGLMILLLPLLFADLPGIWRKCTGNRRVYLFLYRGLLPISITILIPFAIKMTWSYLLDRNGIRVIYSGHGISLSRLWDTWNNSALFHEVFHKWLRAIFKETPLDFGFIKLSFSSFFLLILMMMTLYASRFFREKKRYLQFAVWCLGGGAALYCITLLIYYTFTFTTSEALQLASFSRYVNTYTIGMLFFTIAGGYLYSQRYLPKCPSWFLPLFFLIIMAALPTYYERVRLLFADQKSNGGQYRKQYEIAELFYRMLPPENYRIGIIAQGSNGIEYYINRYYLVKNSFIPAYIPWSLGKPQFKGDIWSRNLTPETWKNQYKDFSYFYIYKINDDFKKNFAVNFVDQKHDILPGRLYRVNADQKLELVPIEQLFFDFESSNLLNTRKQGKAIVERSAQNSYSGLVSLCISMSPGTDVVLDFSLIPQIGQCLLQQISFAIYGDGKDSKLFIQNDNPQLFQEIQCNWKGWRTCEVTLPPDTPLSKLQLHFQLPAGTRNSQIFLDNLHLKFKSMPKVDPQRIEPNRTPGKN